MSNPVFIAAAAAAAANANYGEDSNSTIGDTGSRIGLSVVVGAIAFVVVIAIIAVAYYEYRYKRSRLNFFSSSSSAVRRRYSAGDHAAGAYVQVVVKRDGDGLDAAAINAIPIYTYVAAAAAAAAGGCAVCLGEYKERDEVRLMPECGHVFHRSCIDPWLMIHPTCPICRKTLPPAAATVANQ